MPDTDPQTKMLLEIRTLSQKMEDKTAYDKEKFSEIISALKSQNGRVGKLEEWKWKAAGVLAVIVVVFQIAVPVILAHR